MGEALRSGQQPELDLRSAASLGDLLNTESSAASPRAKSPLLPSARYILVIVGRQKGTESKARPPDNVTLAKTLQPPHLEDEENSICLRKRSGKDGELHETTRTVPGTQQAQEHVFPERYHFPAAGPSPFPSSTRLIRRNSHGTTSRAIPSFTQKK